MCRMQTRNSKVNTLLSWNFLGYEEKQSVCAMKPPNNDTFVDLGGDLN